MQIRYRKSLLLILLTSFILSCASVDEEIWVNGDGSIDYLGTYMLGDMLSMAIESMGDSLFTEENEEAGLDTIMYFNDVINSQGIEMPFPFLYPDLWERSYVRVHGESIDSLKLNFRNYYPSGFDYDKFLNFWSEKNEIYPEVQLEGINSFKDFKYDKDKKVITIPGLDIMEYVKALNPYLSENTVDTIQMMVNNQIDFNDVSMSTKLYLFGMPDTLKTTVYLPSEALFTNVSDAHIDLNEVTFYRIIGQEIEDGKFKNPSGKYIIGLK